MSTMRSCFTRHNISLLTVQDSVPYVIIGSIDALTGLKHGFHYPSWRPELTGVKKCTQVQGPSTRAVNLGSGNRALVSSWDWRTLWLLNTDTCTQSVAVPANTICSQILCTAVSDIASRRHLRSASRHHLTVPRHRLSTLGRRAFSVAGPTVWNSLPDSLSDPALSSDRFRPLLNTNLFRRYHW